MSDDDRNSDLLLRAAYQVSGLTGGRVTFEQLQNVVPLSAERFEHAIAQLIDQSMARREGDALSLTPQGLTRAAGLGPISEPPMFQDI